MQHSPYIVRASWKDAFDDTSLSAAVNATAGRGSNMLSLCELAGVNGMVHSIDIQQLAVDETRRRYGEIVNERSCEGISHLVAYVDSDDELSRVTGFNPLT